MAEAFGAEHQNLALRYRSSGSERFRAADEGHEAGFLGGLQSHSPAVEAYRLVRTNLQYLAVDKPLRSIMITSGLPGEGKSLTAANLALSFANAGKATVLVDADMRRPVQSALFGLPNVYGLSAVLAGSCTLEEALQPVPRAKNLWVLPAGPTPPNPAELLGSRRAQELFTGLINDYEVVIYDTPPPGMVADPLVLAPQVDGVILVVSAENSDYVQSQKAKEALEKVGARILGVILNDVPLKRMGYYARYYRRR
ncbi:CpsD/CapB family tyrosine-protein kinase [Thermaerobacter subterraneus]|uniref:Capsular exopolysaccharide biosynthesis protein n=1 Tax=Thermaerobacter subterraneus DSM 13965 TaxID=867903 RepID=K6PMK2_9FIRM|nr:CpsD/CapB family tyrosine-protein kinase [Thermaerobacter subterraneus]EKP94107.1 capsular exopolysaccharide biosynthesis protein [Thermaerobacter subterraneus DSM 13965]